LATLITLAPHIGLLATDATEVLAFTSPASLGSATLSASDRDNPMVPVSTSDEVEEEEEDVVEEDVFVEGDDGTILLQFVNAKTDLQNVFPVVHAQSISGHLLNKLDKNGFVHGMGQYFRHCSCGSGYVWDS
jgi:hypothetical protein